METFNWIMALIVVIVYPLTIIRSYSSKGNSGMFMLAGTIEETIASNIGRHCILVIWFIVFTISKIK